MAGLLQIFPVSETRIGNAQVEAAPMLFCIAETAVDFCALGKICLERDYRVSTGRDCLGMPGNGKNAVCAILGKNLGKMPSYAGGCSGQQDALMGCFHVRGRVLA